MPSTPTDAARRNADAPDRPSALHWLASERGRPVRLAALGALAASFGAFAAYEVFAPSKDAARKGLAVPGVETPAIVAPQVAKAAFPPPPAPVLRFRPLSSSEAYRANAAIPDSRVLDPAARPFQMADAARSDRGLASTCLTQAVYYEAASESLEGQRAVAQVVLNRVRDPRYPKTVCGVVFQGAALRTGCQFSFTCDGSMRRRLVAAPWRRAHAVAEAALDGSVMTAIGHATHYHTVWVTPYWSPSLVKWGRIGAHIFYRWAGSPGASAARTVAYAGAEAVPPSPADPVVPVLASKGGAAPLVEEPAPPPPHAALPADGQRGVQQVAPPPAPLPPPPYRAVSRRPSLDSPGFAARD